MKKIILFDLLIAALLIACHSDKKNIAAKKEITSPAKSIVADTSAILLKQTYLHAFSDEAKLDTFKLVLRGASINEGKLKFEIISFKNQKIYAEDYDAVDLLGDLDDLSAKQKEDTIRVRFNNFFIPDAFSLPAMGSKVDLTDTDYVDLKTQKDICSDATAIGFTYAIGYETLMEVAYSKRNKKTVVCYASD